MYTGDVYARARVNIIIIITIYQRNLVAILILH